MRPAIAVVAFLLLAAPRAVESAPGTGGAAVLVAGDAKQPSVAVDATGTVYVVAMVRGNVAVSVSKDRGKTLSEPVVAIEAKGRGRAGRQRGPRIGVDGKGRLAVTAPLCFDEAELAKPYPVAELFLATSADGGATWTPPVRVNEVDKKAPESLHAMRVALDGTVHVAWLDRREKTGKGQDLWYARVLGGAVSRNVRIAQDVCECCAPGLALDAAGNPVLAWREGGEGKSSRELFLAASTDGGKTFGKPTRINRGDTKEDG